MINKNNIALHTGNNNSTTENKSRKKYERSFVIKAMEKKLAYKRQRAIAIIYEILGMDMHLLRNMQKNQNDSNKWREEWNKRIGAMETGGSAIIKLIKAFDKIITMEKDARATINAPHGTVSPASGATRKHSNKSSKINIEELKLQWREEKIKSGYKFCNETERVKE
jgi:hypothetical protein